ncbi:MAG: hypothetical protein J7521_12810 [Caulobacter sp.]|nr:hypothetical protein [Caulobacter sp.]
MTPSVSSPITAKASQPAARRTALLVGSALCGVAAMLAQPAVAGTLPGIPGAGSITVSAGGSQPLISFPDAITLQIDLNAPRTVINWSSLHVSSGDQMDFLFDAASDIVLNKTTSQIQIDNGGVVTGKVGVATGGNIWFYSPQGVIVAPGATMTAGGFVFAGGTGLVDANFVNAGDTLSVLRAASNALIQTSTISSATSASINANGDVVLSASSGNLSASTVYGKTAQMSTTSGSITASEVTASTGAAQVSAGGAGATVTLISGATGVTVSSANSSSVGSATTTASGDIVITSSGSASLTLGNSARDILLSAPQVFLSTVDAGRSVRLTGTTQATVTNRIFAGDDIEITADGAVSASSATLKSTGVGASDDAHILVKSTAGAVLVGAAITQGTGVAAGDVTISAFSTAMLGSGLSARDLTVTGAGPLSLTGAYSATNTMALTSSSGTVSQAGGSITADLLTVSAPLGVALNQAANNVVNLGDINAGTGGFSYYDQNSFGLTGGITTTGAVSLTSGSGSIIQTAGAISADTLNVQAETGITLNGANTVANLGDLLNYTSGDISFRDADGFVLNGGVDARGNVSLFADNGDITHVSGNLHGYGAVSLDAAGRIILGDIATDGDFSATAAGDVYVNALQAGGDILVKSTGGSATLRSAVLNGVTPGHDLTLSASGDATLGANDEAGITSSHWFVRGTSTGVTTVRSTSGSASVYLDNSAAIDTVEGGVDANVVVRTGPLSLGAVTASAGNVYVTAGDGNLGVGSASALGDLYVQALDGALTVGSAGAGGYLELYSDGGGALQVSGAVLGDSVHIEGQGLVNLTSTSSIDSGGEVLLGGDTMTIAGSVHGDHNVQIAATGLLDASAAPLISSGDHLTILAGSAAVGPLEAGGRINVGALTGNVDLESGHAGQEVVVVSANGDATVGWAESDSRAVSVQASGDVRVGLAKANGVDGAVDVGGGGDVTLRGGEATKGILVYARDGKATFGADDKASITAANYAITAAAVGCSCAPDTNGLQVISEFGDAVVNVNSLSNPVAVVAGGVDDNTIVTLKTGNLTIDGLAGYNITVEAENGTFSAGDVVSAGGDYTITAHDFLDHALSPNPYFGVIRDVTITDTLGDLNLGTLSLHADRRLTITATNGAVVGAARLDAGTGANDGQVSVTAQGVALDQVSSDGLVKLDGGTGLVNVATSVDVGGDYLLSGGDFANAALAPGGAQLGTWTIMDRAGDFDFAGKTLHYNGSVQLFVNGAVNGGDITANTGMIYAMVGSGHLGALTARQSLVAIGTTGGLSVESATAGPYIRVETQAGGDARLGSATLTGGGANQLIVRSMGTGDAVLGATTPGGLSTANFVNSAGANTTVTVASAAGDVDVNLDRLDGANLTTIDAAGAASIGLANGALTVGRLTAGAGAQVTGGGDVRLVSASVGGDLSVASSAGGLRFGDATPGRVIAATGALTLNAAADVSQQGVLKADTLNVAAGAGVVLLGANQVARLGAVDVAAGGLAFHDTDAFQLTGPINALGQTVDLRSDQAISQASGGVITARALTGSSAGGADFGAANQVAELGAFANAGGLLRLVNARSLTVAGTVLSTGTVSLASHGGMTIAGSGSVRGDGVGDAVTLASDGAFTNARGADAVVAGDAAGRWLIYTQAEGAPLGSTAGNSFNGLSGKSFYGAAYDFAGGGFSRSINAGNRFVYAYQPILIVTPVGQTVVYDGTIPTVSATIGGLVNGDLAGDAWSGAASISGANRNAGTHVLTASAGSLASDLNYGFAYGTGSLNVLKRQVTVTADNLSKTSGYQEPALTYRVTVGDLVTGDAFTGGLARASGESPGPHAITQGTLALSSNYDLTFVGAVLTIDPVPSNDLDGSPTLKYLTQSPDFTLGWDPEANLTTEGQAPAAAIVSVSVAGAQ